MAQNNCYAKETVTAIEERIARNSESNIAYYKALADESADAENYQFAQLYRFAEYVYRQLAK